MDKQEHKFNFSEEEEKKEQAVEQSKQAVKDDAKGLWKSVKVFFNELLDFRHDTDRDATIEAIKGDIPFKGATAWILICSIFVASVGLNANSTAVVIGAMLISPLMGPILGIGMALAINDIDTQKKSLINLATMIVLSLLTAFLFFWLFPLSEDTSELLGRTQPDIRDVLIAFLKRNYCLRYFWSRYCNSINATIVYCWIWFGCCCFWRCCKRLEFCKRSDVFIYY